MVDSGSGEPMSIMKGTHRAPRVGCRALLMSVSVSPAVLTLEVLLVKKASLTVWFCNRMTTPELRVETWRVSTVTTSEVASLVS